MDHRSQATAGGATGLPARRIRQLFMSMAASLASTSGGMIAVNSAFMRILAFSTSGGRA